MPITPTEMARYILELLEKVTKDLTPEQKDRVISAIFLDKPKDNKDK